VLLVALIECLRRAFRPRQFGPTVLAGLTFVAGIAIVVLPGLVIKGILEGSWFATGYEGPLFFWRQPRLLAVGFSAEHGAFLWTPVLLFAVLGLFLLVRRSPQIGSIVLLTFAVFYYTVAAYRSWHGHSAYGSRFLVAVTPLFVFGLAAFVDTLCGTHKRRWMAASVTMLTLVLWNAGFMLQWGTNLVPNRGPVDFRVVARNQVTVVPAAAWKFFNGYFRQRDALIHDLERGDLLERRNYDPKR
jgi:hypothetical protein